MEYNERSIQQAMRMAKSPAGQQLIQMLQQGGGEDLQKAMEQAAAGDYASAKQTIDNLMQDPKARSLLAQLGGGNGSNGR